MSKKWVIRILLGFLVLLIGSQFIRSNRRPPFANPASSFTALAAPPTDIASVLKTACYDCHSNETNYPWYAQVAPISWWIDNDVKEGRKHLNFSTWGTYSFKKQADIAKEAAEEIEEGNMPDKSYTRMHSEARLSDAQRAQLTDYFKNLAYEMQSIPAIPNPSMSKPRK